MGFLDTLLGRTKPVPPKLDDLFAIPTAAITLQAAMGLVPTGTGSVCFRAAEGRAFSDIEKDVRELLSMGEDAAPVEVTTDSYGFTWLVCHHAADDVEALVTDLHAVNSSLVDGGFGPQLLCTLVSFAGDSGETARPRLPVQAGHVLPVRAAGQRAPGQRAGAAGAGRGGGGPEDRTGPQPLVRGLGRPRPVTRAQRLLRGSPYQPESFS